MVVYADVSANFIGAVGLMDELCFLESMFEFVRILPM